MKTAIIFIIILASGCAHDGVYKKCAKVDDSEYKERADQSICSSLWFWE